MTDTPNAESTTQAAYRGPNAWRDASNAWRDASTAARNVVDYLRPPPEVVEHVRAARVEVLKAVRALIDHRIDKLSRVDQRGTKINVE
jgi:hypothetical protein